MARSARLVFALLLLALGACGGGASSGGKVEVRLTDYDVILSTSSVAAGRVDFVIDNTGGFVHEILVVRSDLAVDELPKTADGRFDEQGAGVSVVASATDIAAGAKVVIVERLDPGRYSLICNRPAEAGDTVSHFAHGMLSPFTVT